MILSSESCPRLHKQGCYLPRRVVVRLQKELSKMEAGIYETLNKHLLPSAAGAAASSCSDASTPRRRHF